MLKYYVYAYLRADGTPYYIGKGTGWRAWHKNAGEICPPKDRAYIRIVEANLTNLGSLAIERQLIRWYGRKDIGTGILRNRTPGGDAGSGSKKGRKGRVQSEETKAKLRLANLGKKHTDETKLKCGAAATGKKSEATKQKISESRKGIVFSKEHRENLSKANKGKPKPKKSIQDRNPNFQII